MMEPVAWRNEHGAVTNFKHGADAWRDAGIWSEPLVRLSDAEARIAELEAQLDEALAGDVVPSSVWMRQMELTREAQARAEAAEALLKEAMRLRRMVERRDEFIIGQGLWDKFREACDAEDKA